MKILIDADASPVVAEAIAIGRKYQVDVELFCDTNHVLRSDYAVVHTIGAAKDAVDLALINSCVAGDIVITQDYALAALVLAKKAQAINQNGWLYTEENIDTLLDTRWLSAKMRRAKGKNHLKGPKKRSKEDDEKFAQSLEQLLRQILAAEKD